MNVPDTIFHLDAAILRARLSALRHDGPGVQLRDLPVLPDATGGARATPRPPVPAAVLVPIIMGPLPGILLTKRTAHLSAHAGQVSFPGGRIDAGDRDAEHAALREAQEEIGLDPASVELIGRLPDYITGTGYCVTPVVGLLPPDPGLDLSPHEVESVLQLPLSVVLDPDAPQRRQRMARGVTREFWVWPHPEHEIWGATAAILVNLASVLRGA